MGTTTMWRVLMISEVILFTTAWYLDARFDRTAYSVKYPPFRFFRSQGLRQFSQGCLYRLAPRLPGHPFYPLKIRCRNRRKWGVFLASFFARVLQPIV